MLLSQGSPNWESFFTKGPMKTGMFSVEKRESERIFSVKGMFINNFGIGNMGGGSSVAVDHSCSKLVGVLRLFVFTFICILWIIKIESKIPFEFENRVIPQSRVRKVLVSSWFHGVT